MNETKSILPAKIGGTEITRFNALRHGVLSRYTVLPWEDAAEYGDLVASLVAEHAPLDPDKLERLGRYEVHLDRKLERTLAMTCGGEPMSVCANKPSTPRSAPTRRSCHTSHGCWRK